MKVSVNTLKVRFDDQSILFTKDPYMPKAFCIPEASFNNLCQFMQNDTMILNCHSEDILPYVEDPVLLPIIVMCKFNVYNCTLD
jgi:hypothetical protein